MSQHEIPATFTRDQWGRIAYACGVTGNRDLLISIFVQTGVDPVLPHGEESKPWWKRAFT